MSIRRTAQSVPWPVVGVNKLAFGESWEDMKKIQSKADSTASVLRQGLIWEMVGQQEHFDPALLPFDSGFGSGKNSSSSVETIAISIPKCTHLEICPQDKPALGAQTLLEQMNSCMGSMWCECLGQCVHRHPAMRIHSFCENDLGLPDIAGTPRSLPVAGHWATVCWSTWSPRMLRTFFKSLQYPWCSVHFGTLKNFASSFFLCLAGLMISLAICTDNCSHISSVAPGMSLFSSSSFCWVCTFLLSPCDSEHFFEHVFNQLPPGAWFLPKHWVEFTVHRFGEFLGACRFPHCWIRIEMRYQPKWLLRCFSLHRAGKTNLCSINQGRSQALEMSLNKELVPDVSWTLISHKTIGHEIAGILQQDPTSPLGAALALGTCPAHHAHSSEQTLLLQYP